MHARPRSLADTSLGENGDHKTGHDAMGPPAYFQDGRRTTNVHDGRRDGRRTNSITRNICQSGLSIFQNCRRVSADIWGPQSGRNRQSLEALRAIQRCELGARQAAEKSVGNLSSPGIGLDGRLTPDYRTSADDRFKTPVARGQLLCSRLTGDLSFR